MIGIAAPFAGASMAGTSLPTSNGMVPKGMSAAEVTVMKDVADMSAATEYADLELKASAETEKATLQPRPAKHRRFLFFSSRSGPPGSVAVTVGQQTHFRVKSVLTASPVVGQSARCATCRLRKPDIESKG
ncbi:hypothetical protein FY528_06335 [Hymenobacter lutimineralis]|uniref:Uncharacterized protein n=1 Tax=Hymenobacter lutimineralis TaxID=2606448 RepID=A0A5D6V9X5_9BACT|nr:hypothetical protein [Hymenobacter lutimineralis]TYZ11962.1 hypothetical protein FY528_06335 [Hymenobacter lutimineralis]